MKKSEPIVPQWIKYEDKLPPHNEIVYTKVQIGKTIVSEQFMSRVNNTMVDSKKMPVKVLPTHWKFRF